MPLVRVSLAQRSRGRGAVAVLDRSEGSSVAVVLLADLAVVGGRAHRGALLSLHGGALDLRDLVAHLPGDVPALLSLHLVTHLTQHNSSQYKLSHSYYLSGPPSGQWFISGCCYASMGVYYNKKSLDPWVANPYSA